MADFKIFLRLQAAMLVLGSILLSVTVGAYASFEDSVVIVCGRVVTGLLMTTLLHLCYQSRWLKRAEGWIKWPVIVLINLALVQIGTMIWLRLIDLGAREIVGLSPFLDLKVARGYFLLVWNLVYWGLDFILRYHALTLEAAESRFAIRSAELKQLQEHINPHFLFNALTLVQSKIPDDSPAQEVIHRLSSYLRFSFESSRPLEPLAREFDMLECYLDLQRARFGDQLDCSIEATPEALNVWAPVMLVQPLLENAFKYGPRSSPQPLRVEITAVVEKGRLLVEVVNTGNWFSSPEAKSCGTGLANLRRRLTLLMGESAELNVSEKEGCVRAKINIPSSPVKFPWQGVHQPE